MWLLYASVEVPAPEVIEPTGFLGVDMGIANTAYDSAGTRYAGDRLNGYRRRQLRLRRRLQEKATKSARRLLARRNRKETLHQLGSFLAYKARRAGVPLVQVDPRHTSQTCHGCGHRDKRNRPDQETFHCRSCGVVAHADRNAALNIAQRGVEGWGAVNRPHAASPCTQ